MPATGQAAILSPSCPLVPVLLVYQQQLHRFILDMFAPRLRKYSL